VPAPEALEQAPARVRAPEVLALAQVPVREARVQAPARVRAPEARALAQVPARQAPGPGLELEQVAEGALAPEAPAAEPQVPVAPAAAGMARSSVRLSAGSTRSGN